VTSRVRDTPISEEGFVGAAMLGQRPVVKVMMLNAPATETPTNTDAPRKASSK
jgi:pyruvate/2-oxoglutarate/acetoin dehydrogenase E1 component